MSCAKCCCNCKSQIKVFKHPWNKDSYVKGSITELMGYVCISAECNQENTGIFFDREHSLCECYEFNKGNES
jgi:hypothetical protein